MADISSTNKNILGQGLLWNARSGMLERVVDFAAFAADTASYFEIGTLPKGFVPRNIALVQLTGVDSANTVKVYKTKDSVELASITAAASGDMASVFKPFDAAAVASSTATVTPSMDAVPRSLACSQPATYSW